MISFNKLSTSRYLVIEHMTLSDGTVNLFKVFCDNAQEMHSILNRNYQRWLRVESLGNSRVYDCISNNYKPANVPVAMIENQCKRHGRLTAAKAYFSTGKAELNVIALYL